MSGTGKGTADLQTTDLQMTLRNAMASSPLPPPVLHHLALAAARSSFVLLALVLLTASFRNWPDHLWATALHSISVTLIGIASFKDVKIEPRKRVMFIALVLLFSAVVAQARNELAYAGALIWSPMPPLLMLAFSARFTIAASGLAHLVILGASFVFWQRVPGDAIWVLWGFLFSLVTGTVAKFAVVIVNQLLQRTERDRVEVDRLMRERLQLGQVVVNELRVPVMSLSMLLHRPDEVTLPRNTVRDFVEQLRLIVDNLASTIDDAKVRPVAMSVVSVPRMMQQIELQLGPVLQSFGVELIVDVSNTADIAILSDKFRLRTVLGNLLRNAANDTDGHRVWLNVCAEQIDAAKVHLSMVIEDNGHGDGLEAIASAVGDESRSSADMIRSGALGLRVAREWLSSIGGTVEVFKSPRGGVGLRLKLEAVTAESPEE